MQSRANTNSYGPYNKGSSIARWVLTHGARGEREARRVFVGAEGKARRRRRRAREVPGAIGVYNDMMPPLWHRVSLGTVISYPAVIPLPPSRCRPRVHPKICFLGRCRHRSHVPKPRTTIITRTRCFV